MQQDKKTKAVAALEDRAGRGDVEAFHGLYWAYATGKGVARDTMKAMTFLRRGAEGGHALSQRFLATETYGQDPEGSLVWALRASEQGDAPAMVHAARRLIAGRNAPTEPAKALALFERAASLGDEDAQAALESERTRASALARPPLESLEEAARAVGLGRQWKRVVELTAPSVRLVSRVCTENEIGIGASKLGGLPDLAARTPWPERSGRPLTFLAQLDLATLAAQLPAGVLPADGVLSFFYDSEEQPWGYTGESDGWRVIYHPTGRAHTKLARRKAPARASTFQPCALETFSELTVAPTRSALTRTLPEKSWDAYSQLETLLLRDYRRRPLEDGKIHRTLGHPDAIQGDMTRRIEYMLAEADIEKPTKELEARAATWRLLLQVDSDDAAGMMWGNLGRLYFWIREADLAARRFEAAWLQFQNT